ncbi:RNA polymerase sigma factor [Methylophilus aquaticus]|uniref:Sigma-70 family RNA polymerase sigma factor n=1 Tax=Methylophilus aquaticus TaxID=1971610 RepID=A0ABT9JX60_9PROT|nr:sigma-70 family RNA polymerase sigma factor [Methylophilus aquaticus]MDP8568676.1 sigma-70 family RNA polymerase sigma factor [Methylophilus aquaticus]
MRFFTQANTDFYWSNLNLKWVYTELFSSIYRQTRNVHVANDVLHDAIVKFAVKNSLKQIHKPHAYLRGIVKNTIIDHYREAAYFIDISQTSDQEIQSPEQELSYQHSPEKIADIKQRMQALQNIIDCLPPKCRQVFWLHRIEGMAQTDIATDLKISLNMVEKHMIRALVDIALAKRHLLGE